MNVLLTGSAGFIGSHIAEALEAAGHHVRGLDLHPGAHDDGARDGARDGGHDGGRADVRDAAAVARLLAAAAVCHQAAKVGLGATSPTCPTTRR
ncbi:NAD-dependent epimerase/dehydratase family protein [Actinomadura sp. CNU-125]|uniref:NAD-dependent epimerase/dehydratase family protein n=1 Tax=Actinomadura sp. CNU-125 TaxID=1904961 RepID=UPI0021CCF2B1|nr:NAD-dependent epimerase/dehydratase family protein [Actinomadura sp. CNU-125]